MKILMEIVRFCLIAIHRKFNREASCVGVAIATTLIYVTSSHKNYNTSEQRVSFQLEYEI